MTPAVQSAIEELKAERTRIDGERDRIDQALGVLEGYAGGGNGAAAPAKPAKTGAFTCKECGKTVTTARGLAQHKTMVHG